MLGQREAQNVGEAQMADSDPRQRVQGHRQTQSDSGRKSQAVNRGKACWKALGAITKTGW